MNQTTLTQGQQYMGGIVNFDAQTGQRLGAGQTTVVPAFTPAMTGTVVPPGTPLAPTGPINPATLTGQPMAIPPQQQPSNSANSFIAGVTASQPTVQDYYNQLAPLPSDVQKNSASLTDKLSNMIGLTVGRTAATQAAEDAQGVSKIRQNITDLNGQISTKMAEYNAKQAALNSTPMSFAAASGYEAAINNQKASEIGLLQAQALAQTGQLNNALDMAKRAVDLQFGPIEEKIAAQEKQLALLDKDLTREEQRQKDAQTLYLQAQKDKITEEKANKKAVQDLIINASSQNAPQALVQKAAQAATPMEAAQILGVYAGDALQRQVQLANIRQSNASAANSYASAAKTAAEQKLLQNPGVSATLTSSQQKRADALQGDFDNLTKTQRGVITAADNIAAIAERAKDNPTAQVALVYQYMKALDPNSTVREGEYATAKNTTGIPGKLLNNYNKAVKGKIINNEQIASYVADAKKLAEESGKQLNSYSKDFDRRAAQSGLPSGLFYENQNSTPDPLGIIGNKNPLTNPLGL